MESLIPNLLIKELGNRLVSPRGGGGLFSVLEARFGKSILKLGFRSPDIEAVLELDEEALGKKLKLADEVVGRKPKRELEEVEEVDDEFEFENEFDLEFEFEIERYLEMEGKDNAEDLFEFGAIDNKSGLEP